MSNLDQSVWRMVSGQPEREAWTIDKTKAPLEPRAGQAPELALAPDDPLILYFRDRPEPVRLHGLELDSPALEALKTAGVRLAVPLVSHDELVGLLNLGTRPGGEEPAPAGKQEHTSPTEIAPPVHVTLLVKQRQAVLQAREQSEREAGLARLIQLTLLPKQLPALRGWEASAYYLPAPTAGGDFYDFINLPGGLLGIVVGDAAGKGLQAALAMAAAQATVHAIAARITSPRRVLEQANDLLCRDIPPRMFVTCLYAVLNPETGRLVFANAGHALPYRGSSGGAAELRATGMPLGLMAGIQYEEKEIIVEQGENLLFSSNGLVEARSPGGEMFSSGRLHTLASEPVGALALIRTVVDELARFRGPDRELEDDVMLVALERSPVTRASRCSDDDGASSAPPAWRMLGEFSVASEPGGERQAIREVAEALRGVPLGDGKLERIKTAVGEATMNAMEHGNGYRSGLPVRIQVRASDERVSIRITDEGKNEMVSTPEAPDLQAKLEGRQPPRGWGLFLIRNMVDRMNILRDESHHTVELIVYLKGESHVSQPA